MVFEFAYRPSFDMAAARCLFRVDSPSFFPHRNGSFSKAKLIQISFAVIILRGGIRWHYKELGSTISGKLDSPVQLFPEFW